jgi:hypothetical protein
MTAPPRHPVKSRAVSALLAHAIDYAGLYPPASLSMADAVREYQNQRFGPDAWALGRFVVGAAQLEAFAAAREQADAVHWPISVLSTGNVADDVRLIAAAEAHSGKVRVEAIEAKVASPGDVADLAPLTQLVPELYVEGPAISESKTLLELLRAVHSLGARAKIRTGGVTPDAIPSARVTAEFLRACMAVGVPFKATAGLHHLVRGEYPLTYEPASARATMFGFLNVFMASALAHTDAPLDLLVEVLEEREPNAFATRDEQLCWRDRCLTSATFQGMRAKGLHSFGSCSFQEPIAELTAAGFRAAE